MAPRIVWRYRRKRHSPSAAASRRQARSFGTVDFQSDSGPQINSSETAHRRDSNRFTDDPPLAAVQFQEEEETQPKVQFQEEEESVQTTVQFQEEEEEETVQAKLQFQEEEEEETVQAKFQFQEEEEAAQAKPETVPKRSGRLIRVVARSGFRGHPGAYPFRHRIQAAFGSHPISNVRAFSDAGAHRANRRLGTLAYASREKVAFRGYPDLHTAAHEAAHIIQQRNGVNLRDGAGRKGDAYERHADAVADRVVRGKSVESLLNRDPASDGG